MSKIKSFVREFKAAVKGDDVAVLAEKTFRQSSSALKTHINSLEGDTVTFEDKIDEAKEVLANARINNGKPITDKAKYVQNLVDAKNIVTQNEAELSKHQAKIDFLKDQLSTLEVEVEEEEA